MKKKIKNGEIDLIDIIIDIWSNKFKIILITLVIITLVLAYNYYKKPKIIASTQIEKISIFDENLYQPYNIFANKVEIDLLLNSFKNNQDLNEDLKKDLIEKFKVILNLQNDKKNSNKSGYFKFNQIDAQYLENMYIAKLKDRKVLEDGIDKFELINKEKFQNKDLYLEAVEKLAFKIKLIPPNRDPKDKKKNKDYWEIQFKTLDVEKWNKLLNYINDKINNEIKDNLIFEFNRQKNIFELLQEFELENINTKINNYKKNYENKIKSRLIFLADQAEIARKSNIADNDLMIDTAKNSSNYFLNENLYYKKGYNEIEKEIELIKKRYGDNIYDEYLVKLENDKRNILESNNIKRFEKIFMSTPIYKSDTFKAANLIYLNTNLEKTRSTMKILLISIIIGLLLGILYVITNSAIQKRK